MKLGVCVCVTFFNGGGQCLIVDFRHPYVNLFLLRVWMTVDETFNHHMHHLVPNIMCIKEPYL